MLIWLYSSHDGKMSVRMKTKLILWSLLQNSEHAFRFFVFIPEDKHSFAKIILLKMYMCTSSVFSQFVMAIFKNLIFSSEHCYFA